MRVLFVGQRLAGHLSSQASRSEFAGDFRPSYFAPSYALKRTMLGLVAETIALVATAIFAGAAVYVSLVEHPARERCGPALALAGVGPSYRRAATLQGGLEQVGAA